MKPKLLIALINLGLVLPTPAISAPTHLTCSESTTTRGTPSDRIVFINSESGTASLGGQQRDLYVEPNQFRLMKVETVPRLLISKFVINRTTLKFTSSVSVGNIKRESTGQCLITSVAPGAQI